MYLPKSPGQCSTRLTTIGSANTALMTATGIQARRCSRKNSPTDARSVAFRGHRTAASTAIVSTGTKNKKQACPWMRNQPVSAKIQASCARPAATDPAAMTNTMYASTYMYGIQSEFTIGG